MTRLHKLNEFGQSVWYDNIRRALLESGELADLIQRGVTGVTSNPTIFEKAITGSVDYDSALHKLAEAGLDVVDNTLTRTISDFKTLEDTLQTASQGVDDSVPMVENLSGLLSENIPQAISSTQTGLRTLQDAAGTLETTLQLVTSIPFLPIENYSPDVSFTTALEDVAVSLDAIPQSLSEMEDSLNSTQGNLVMLSTQVRIMSRSVSDLKSDLYDIQLVIKKYQDVFVLPAMSNALIWTI